MSVAAMVSPGVGKEIRALLPMWALSIAGLGGAFVWGESFWGLIAYGAGVLALGAQSVGQEYAYRTLPLLLSQPIDRRRLLVLKAAVLVPMLLTLLAIAGLVFPYADGRGYSTGRGLAVLLLPVLCSLLLTPWLTMLCRSPLAGVVFSIALPGGILTLARVLSPWSGTAFSVGIGAMLMICAVAGVLGWQRFMRLEAVDAADAPLHLPRMFRTGRPHHPLWMLTLKELHLQQMTFALVAVYLTIWVSLSVAQGTVPAAEISLDVLTPLSLFLLTLLIGSVASAEERQYGTMDWQQLLPVAASRQWMVKVAVVFALATVFAIGLPSLLGWITDATGGRGGSVRTEVALLVIVSTAVSLYISSLCRSGMHAAVLSIAVVPLALALYVFVLRAVVDSLLWLLSDTTHVRSLQYVEEISVVVLEGLIVALLVRLAYVNHRSADPTTGHVLRQLLLIVLCLAGGCVVFAGALIGLARR
jgi:hypothetical protein